MLEYLGLAEFDPQPNKYLFAPLIFLFLDHQMGGGGNGNIKIIFDIFFLVCKVSPLGPPGFLLFCFPLCPTAQAAQLSYIPSHQMVPMVWEGGIVVFIYCPSSFPTVCSFLCVECGMFFSVFFLINQFLQVHRLQGL